VADRKHIVRAGECFCTIAEDSGHFWQTLWDLAANAALREARKNPNLLVEGDEILVPDLRPRTVTVATGGAHRFKRHGVPSFIRVRCERFGEPLADLPFTTEANGTLHSDTTDADGVAVVPLAPDVREVRLVIGSGASAHVVELDVGTLSPVTTDEGVRARLGNLGFTHERLEDAVRAFQRSAELTASGVADDATRAALVESHGC
jgi:putative peptidoglycan binding protein